MNVHVHIWPIVSVFSNLVCFQHMHCSTVYSLFSSQRLYRCRRMLPNTKMSSQCTIFYDPPDYNIILGMPFATIRTILTSNGGTLLAHNMLVLMVNVYFHCVTA